MFDEEFQKLVHEAFVTEAAALLQSMTSGLQEIEQAPAAERRAAVVATIHRDAHSLKGASATVDRLDISRVCLALEHLFAKWKTSIETPPPATFASIRRALDHLGVLLNASTANIDPADQMKATQIANELTALGSAA